MDPACTMENAISDQRNQVMINQKLRGKMSGSLFASREMVVKLKKSNNNLILKNLNEQN